MNELDRLLATDDFYDGKSENPIHIALGLSLPVVKLAHLSVSAVKLLDLELVTAFSLEEQNTFARLLVKANEFLSQKDRKPLPLLRLSPRMLLPYSIVKAPLITSQPEVKSSLIDEIDNSTNNRVERTESSVPDRKGKKKLSHKQKLKLKEAQTQLKTPSKVTTTGPVNASDTATLNEHQRKQLQQLSISSQLPSLLLQKAHNAELNIDILQLCQEYEDLLLHQREHWESVSQSANLRLFIAENENCDLKDKIKELQLQISEISSQLDGNIR